MANRDYAAGIDPQRRISLWGRITKGVNLETDWNSAPPLTAGLRERFPDLLSRPSPANEPPVPDVLQPGQHATIRSHPPRTRVDSMHNLEAKERMRRDLPRTIVLGGVRHQRSVKRRPSQRSRSQQNPHQQRIRETTPDHDLPSAAPNHGQVQSAMWNADSHEDPQSAPAPFPRATPPSHRQQQDPNHDLRQHTTNFPQLSLQHPGYRSSRTPTLRRVPVQSSLRNQVLQDANHSTEARQLSNRINRAATTANHDVPAVVRAGGYSHYPAYSPLPPANPHALPRPHNRSSSVATYASTPTLQQSSPLPTNNSNIPQLPEHAEFSPPFAHFSPGSLSNSSIETFANPNNPTGPPLSKHDANIEGLKQRIMAPCRSWKVKVARILKRVKSSLAIL